MRFFYFVRQYRRYGYSLPLSVYLAFRRVRSA